MVRVTRILCPVDFSEPSQHALDHAAAVAHWYGAALTVVYVFTTRPSMDLPPLVLEDAERERLMRALRAVTAHVPRDVGLDLRVAEAGAVHEEIIRLIGDAHADLLVIGTHGRSGWQHLFLGSVTEKVIRKATCPSLVVPPRAADVAADAPVRFTRILCAVDFSDTSLLAVAYALNLAEEADAHLTLLHVIETPPELRADPLAADFDVDRLHAAAQAEARRRLRDLVPDAARTFCTVETAVAEGRAYRYILQQAAARQSNLIVMGVHGRGAVDLLLFGSTTHHVVRAAACPVLIIRG